VNVGSIDRRNGLLILACIVLFGLVLRYRILGDSQSQVVAPAETIQSAETRLQRVRQLAALVPGKEELLKQANLDLAKREKGLLSGDTAEQAKAQLLDVIHRVANANQIDARGLEQSNVKALANDYGEVSVAITFSCDIEQLVNFLAQVADEPLILATSDINVTGGSDKTKKVTVRLTLSGVVPKKLVPAKKGVSAV